MPPSRSAIMRSLTPSMVMERSSRFRFAAAPSRIRQVRDGRGLDGEPDRFAGLEDLARRRRDAQALVPGQRHEIVPELAEVSALRDAALDAPEPVAGRRRAMHRDALR